MSSVVKCFRFDALLQQQGWVKPAYIGVDGRGLIQYISDGAPEAASPVEIVHGATIPGFPNGHSHAFQYAMAGMADKHAPGSTDDFWTWREAMYDCALRMRPDQMEAIAAKLYAEMLRRGYTHVAEFHYLHHDINGRAYANLSETGERLLSAAQTAGIKITLIPVFYQMGGFDRPAESRQRRFLSKTVDDYFELLEATETTLKHHVGARLGFGVHSLRAVTAADVCRTFESGPRDLPFHLHAAEQIKEVEDCVSILNQRPVEWLLNNLPLQERFNIVHCTHLNDDEVKRLAQSRANVVLCPGTEGNLGDGMFRLTEYARQYGNFCIGTDSHISLNPMEDLRWLDYGQRLTTHKRNTFDDAATVLMNKVIPCGRSAVGDSRDNFFELNSPLDAIVFDIPLGWGTEHLLPSVLYTTDSSSIKGTIINGQWVVKDQVHKNHAFIQKLFEKAMRDIWKD
jgi:formimidoylglutamate deiminase